MIISQSMPLIILLRKDRKIEKILKEVSNGLPQGFLPLNSEDMLSILCIDWRVFSGRLYKRATRNEQATKRNSETSRMHFNFSWNWILNFCLFLQSKKRSQASCQDVICWLNCQTDELVGVLNANIVFLIT